MEIAFALLLYAAGTHAGGPAFAPITFTTESACEEFGKIAAKRLNRYAQYVCVPFDMKTAHPTTREK